MQKFEKSKNFQLVKVIAVFPYLQGTYICVADGSNNSCNLAVRNVMQFSFEYKNSKVNWRVKAAIIQT